MSNRPNPPLRNCPQTLLQIAFVLPCLFAALAMPGADSLAQAATPQPGQTLALYEEDPVASMAIREQQWRQLTRYADTLASGKLRASSRPLTLALPDFHLSFDSLGAYRRGTERLRTVLRDRLGCPPPGWFKKPALRLEKAGEDSLADYYRCYITLAPDLECYGLYLAPKNLRRPAPLVISMHGGGGFPELALFRGGANYHDLVRGPLKQGWIVFAPLHLFYPYGDRDHGTAIPQDVREQLDARLRDHGCSLAAVEVAKISKALDVLLKRPEIDRRRVAMAGLSYGGFYTLYTAALEPRIRAAVASCCFGHSQAGAADAPLPAKPGGRLIDLTTPELAALICPRPLQVQAGVKDSMFPIDVVRQQAQTVADYYRRLKLPERFSFAAFDGGHEFKDDAAWAFLKTVFYP